MQKDNRDACDEGADDRQRHGDREGPSPVDGPRGRHPGGAAAALPLRNMLELTDATGLAAFTVTGVVIAVRFGAVPLLLWGPLCAALTAAGGGILRDLLRADSNNPALHTSFYAEICLIWGLMLRFI